MSIGTILPYALSAVILSAWFGFLGWIVWTGWRELKQEGAFDDSLRQQPWTTLEKWLVGLGSAFIAAIVFERITGSSDTAFFNGVISLVGTLAVLAWMFTAFGAALVLLWRLSLYVRRRRARRRI